MKAFEEVGRGESS